MELHELPTTTKKKKKRLGRGYASMKGGHTSSRGQKGQNARNSTRAWFEGGQLPFIRRFPFQRGKNRFGSLNAKTTLITLSQLGKFADNETVTLETLVAKKIINQKQAKTSPIKIVGQGTISIPLIVTFPVSAKAAQKIKAAGGTVSLLVD